MAGSSKSDGDRCGSAAVELGEEPLGIALIGHQDEGLFLDPIPAFLADIRSALFLFP